MNATTVPVELPRIRTTSRWSPRLVRAELLKLRKRRGLVGATLALTIVPMIVAYIVLVALHAADPAKHGPAGGIENFTGSVNLLGSLTIVAAILVGATAGTGDLGAGVFRELVVTGRSRLALFAARVPAGLGFVLAAVGLSFVFTFVASTLLAGSLEGPGAQAGRRVGRMACTRSGALLRDRPGRLVTRRLSRDVDRHSPRLSARGDAASARIRGARRPAGRPGLSGDRTVRARLGPGPPPDRLHVGCGRRRDCCGLDARAIRPRRLADVHQGRLKERL